MALPVLPADGDNPWGAPLRSALTDISNRADQGISAANAAQTELTGVHNTVNTNVTTLASYGTRLTTVENSNATKAADSVVVKLTGDQSISGVKSFTQAPSVPDNSFEVSKINTLTTQLSSLAPKANPVFTGVVSGIDKTMVGLANVDNTTDLNKPVSTATQAALDLKASTVDLTSAIQTHNHTGGVNGVNIPVSAVTGLQTSLNTITTKEPTLRYASATASDIAFDTTAWTVEYCWMVRWGRWAYIDLLLATKQIITVPATGNITNTYIGQIKTTSEFYRVIDGASSANQNGIQFALSSVATGLTANGVLFGLDSDLKKGTIYLAAVGTNTNLPVGYEISLAGGFLLDNSTG